MIDKLYQLKLLLGAVEDYQNGLMSLQTLIWKVEGLLNIIESKELKRELQDPLFTLEEINAYVQVGDGYDFQSEGKPIVDRAVFEIVERARPYLSRLA